jgi:hypothetical protein
MSRIGNLLKRGNRSLSRDEGATAAFVWAGNVYRCTVGTSSIAKKIDAGGLLSDMDLVLYVEADTLPDPPPKAEQILVQNGVQYRIEKLSTLPGESLVRIDCMARHKV